MNAVLLSRIQFGLTAGFHFIFPPLTLGLTLILLIIESLYLKSDNEVYKKISSFLVKILALVFTMGVATGIVLEFSFGTNWSNYARIVGDIFGAPLAAEAVFAFFLESAFLGVLIFGRDKVSKRTYWLSSLFVFIGSHLSGLWIIIANSWMQTPAGFKMEGGRAVLTSFYQAVLNDSTLIRFAHTIMGGWITGALFAAGIGAWYLIKKRSVDIVKPMISVALTIFIAVSLLQFVSGHIHAVQVADTQPAKMAAFEALWKGQTGAPMSIIGIPVESAKKTYFEIRVPKLLSLLIHFDPNGRVAGLDEFPTDETPPVLMSYLTYHLMIGLGSLFALIALTGLFLKIRGKLFEATWYQYLLLFAIPLPFISNILGWMSAEIGRQPWAVYKILRTADAASVVVPAGQILFTIIIFSLIYMVLFALFITMLVKILRQGPETASSGY